MKIVGENFLISLDKQGCVRYNLSHHYFTERKWKEKEMTQWHNGGTDALCEALLTLKTKKECYAFLEDICTIKEILDISQRLEVARMLKEKRSYTAITKETGASAATISRVSRCLEYGSGGYKTVIYRLNEEKNNG